MRTCCDDRLNPASISRSVTPTAWQTPALIRRSGASATRTTTPLAESVIGLYKTKVIRRRGPWRHLEAVEFATLEWVDWFNHRRLLAPIGHVPPAECEQQYYLTQEAPVMAAGVN